MWTGNLRRNAAITIEAGFVRRSGRLFYSEVIRSANGTVTVISDCGEHPEVAAYDSPASAPTNNDAIADASAKSVQCLDKAIIAMALSSTEPAETIVRAARGACGFPTIAFDQLSANLDRQLDNMMIARVLAIRARAARAPEPSPDRAVVQPKAPALAGAEFDKAWRIASDWAHKAPDARSDYVCTTDGKQCGTSWTYTIPGTHDTGSLWAAENGNYSMVCWD